MKIKNIYLILAHMTPYGKNLNERDPTEVMVVDWKKTGSSNKLRFIVDLDKM